MDHTALTRTDWSFTITSPCIVIQADLLQLCWMTALISIVLLLAEMSAVNHLELGRGVVCVLSPNASSVSEEPIKQDKVLHLLCPLGGQDEENIYLWWDFFFKGYKKTCHKAKQRWSSLLQCTAVGSFCFNFCFWFPLDICGYLKCDNYVLPLRPVAGCYALFPPTHLFLYTIPPVEGNCVI